MKKVINEELRICSCSIKDVTSEESTKIIFECYYEGFNLADLRIYYHPKTDIITLIEDTELFEEYKKVTESYLKLSPEDREGYKINNIALIKVLDTVLEKRVIIAEKKLKQELFKPVKELLGNQYIPSDDELGMIDMIYKNAYDYAMARVDLYNYAFIQGKRAERARRKKGLKKVEEMKPKELYNELEGMKVNEPERFNLLKAATTLNSEQLKKLLSAVENIQQVGVEA
jgi:hypothetical protein